MAEFDWIRQHFAPLCTDHSVSADLKDDTASLTLLEGEELVITTDTLIESVHFFEHTTPHLIAQKALRVNLSDIAASGARATYYTLALSVTDAIDENWIRGFCEGLKHDQELYGISLIGGDTTKTSGPLTLTITLYGIVAKGKKLTRRHAKAKDNIYVTGTIGESRMGLEAIRKGVNDDAHHAVIARYLLPEPRLGFATALIDLASSCMDISDGLAQDLEHICTASEVGAIIQADGIPVAEPTDQIALSITELISGGDDYELLFTAKPDMHDTLMQIANTHNVAITKIGNTTQDRTITFKHDDGTELMLERKGYQHV
ncbi:MAG: thiamine-phosphate kinase [Rickettsiales bacterium]|nr:thiamine-phosphate kinase [Rickettsiales bacterium]